MYPSNLCGQASISTSETKNEFYELQSKQRDPNHYLYQRINDLESQVSLLTEFVCQKFDQIQSGKKVK